MVHETVDSVGSSAVQRNYYTLAGVSAGNPFTWTSGGAEYDEVLDLTDPLNPATVGEGVYTVSIYMICDTPGADFQIVLDLDLHNDDIQASAWGTDGDAFQGYSSATATACWYMAAGLTVTARGGVIGAVDKVMHGNATVVFQPASVAV
jgi:hypothetical protein